MKYRRVRQAGFEVSVVGFGVWTVGTTMWGVPKPDFETGERLLRHALDRGITFYDTADVYGDGKGETLLARAFAGRRDDIVIATKFGYDFYTHPGVQPGQRERPHDWSPAFVRQACERSLERLGTDRIDFYQLHNPRLDTIRDDALFAELGRLKQAGKIRAIGVALGPAIAERQVEEAIVAVRERGADVQIIYNLLETMIGEPVFPVARAHGAAVFTRVPHSSGLLEGRYTERTTFGKDDHRSFRVADNARRQAWLVDGLKRVETLQFLTAGTGRTIAQAAIQYILAEPSVAAVLPNIYEENQVDEFAAAADVPPLTAEELAKVRALQESDFGLTEAPAQAAK